MYKVEQRAIHALQSQRAMICGQGTMVTADYNGNGYCLIAKGYPLATVNSLTGYLRIYNHGIRDVVFKSRMNAVLDWFAPGWSIVQRHFVWFLCSPDGAMREWEGLAEFSFPAPLSEVRMASVANW